MIIRAISAFTMLVGWQEGHPACTKMGDGGGGHWLFWMEWGPAGWSVCLPLFVDMTLQWDSNFIDVTHILQ